MAKTVFIIACCAMLYFLGMLVEGTLRDARLAWKSSSWPQATAVVEVSSIAHNQYKIEYTFPLQGQSYRGSNLRFGNFFSQLSTLSEQINNYPVGKSVAIHYNPQDPQQSVIIAGFGFANFAAMLTLLVFLILFVWLLVYIIRTPVSGVPSEVTEGRNDSFLSLGTKPVINLEKSLIGWLITCGIILLPIAFTVFAVAGFVENLNLAKKSEESFHWPLATAKIIHSSIKSRKDHNEKDYIRYLYSPLVVYEFKISERLYTAERIRYIGSEGPDLARAQAVVGRYPVGARVSVHYNPQNPLEAVLELTSPKHNYMIAAICLVTAMIIPLLILWRWRRRKSNVI